MSCLRVVRQVNTGMWRSLVARVVRDDEVAGSNPVIPTNPKPPESNLQGVLLYVPSARITHWAESNI